MADAEAEQGEQPAIPAGDLLKRFAHVVDAGKRLFQQTIRKVAEEMVSVAKEQGIGGEHAHLLLPEFLVTFLTQDKKVIHIGTSGFEHSKLLCLVFSSGASLTLS